jgi:tetratricopeptide (TPR) repeat protein
MADLSGQSLGAYHLLRQIGRGGMGEVYLAEDQTRPNNDDRRQVAIKVVRVAETTLSSDAGALRLFREGRFLIELAHPHILPIYHDGIRDDLLYLVMPYVPDGSLADAIQGRSHLQLQLPLALDRVLDYIEQVAEGLHYVHDRQVIHRDVKPGNVLIQVQPDGRWWLLLADFGIARRLDTTTQEAHWHGTVAYMAPEQFRGQVSPATDQYALGVLAFQLLSGQVPFGMSPPTVRILNPAVPDAVEAVLLQALATRPEERFSSVTAFAEALRRAIDSPVVGSPVVGTSASDPGLPDPPAPGSPAKAAPPSLAEEDALAPGRALLAEGKYVEAVAFFQRATRLDSRNAAAWLNLAYVHGALQQWQEGLMASERALELRPESRTALRYKGMALFHLKRFEDAVAAYEQVVGIDVNDAAAWKGKGIALAKLRRYEEALASYEQGLTLEADDADAWYDLGLVLVRLGRYEAAAEAYDQTVCLNPSDPLARSNKAIALLLALGHEAEMQEANRQAKEEALVSANATVGLHPDEADAWYHLGYALHQLRRYRQALDAYDQALARDPKKGSAWSNKGHALLRLGRYEEAVEACDHALAIDQTAAEAWGTRAIALFSLARYQEAATAYERARTLNEEYGVAVDAPPAEVPAGGQGATTKPDDEH